MAEVTDISPVVKPMPQQIIIEVIGEQARINISGLEPLQVIMLMSQFIGMMANEIKKNQGSAPHIVIPGVMR